MAETRKRDRGGAARLVPLPPPRPGRARPLHRRRRIPAPGAPARDLRHGRPRHLDDAGAHRHRPDRLPHARGPHLPPRRARPRLGLRRDRAARRRPALGRRHRRHRLHALAFERRDFLPLLEHNWKLAEAVLRVICGRLRSADAHIADLAFSDLPGRLAKTLIARAQPGPAAAGPASPTPRARLPPWSAAAARR